MATLNYSTIPVDYMGGGVQRYIEHGIAPGSFLTAVICNDLREAIGRADINNRVALFDWVTWFYNEAPHNCWGSREAMIEWMKVRQNRVEE